MNVKYMKHIFELRMKDQIEGLSYLTQHAIEPFIKFESDSCVTWFKKQFVGLSRH